jgi:hypothetical protein
MVPPLRPDVLRFDITGVAGYYSLVFHRLIEWQEFFRYLYVVACLVKCVNGN